MLDSGGVTSKIEVSDIALTLNNGNNDYEPS